ncbi:MAG TPA: hypothetical protein VG347_19085 [Verrucomicrobiae bacterium]|nr:hypothetical protein [Verrucomicrobiae bacterium]
MAIEEGYLHGDLKGGTSADAAINLPPDYTKTAKAVAERQGALAGYRLADEIQGHLKWAKVVALLPENTNRVVQAESPSKIGTVDASKHYDETMIITGKVVQVTVRPTVTFVNLDASGPNSPFTAVIFQANAGQFGDVQQLKHRDVEITGTVTEFHNKPEIVLESTNQLKEVK